MLCWCNIKLTQVCDAIATTLAIAHDAQSSAYVSSNGFRTMPSMFNVYPLRLELFFYSFTPIKPARNQSIKNNIF